MNLDPARLLASGAQKAPPEALVPNVKFRAPPPDIASVGLGWVPGICILIMQAVLTPLGRVLPEQTGASQTMVLGQARCKQRIQEGRSSVVTYVGQALGQVRLHRFFCL